MTVVGIVEHAARQKKDIAKGPSAQLIFAYFDEALNGAAKRHGRRPTAAEACAELRRNSRMRGLSSAGFEWLVKCRLLDSAEEMRAADQRRSVELRAHRVARRYVNLSLCFLPRGERERYRQEWGAEMATLAPVEADRFAREVLRMAVKSGTSLRLRELFGKLVT
ncbi:MULTISPECIES: hypothetical protein [unclassified Streptomyces]|uniref:hypothetical protein n=1 Tax=unclassified Streptomyces TaxID=2593676 RepID=UPI0009633A3A|nr:hypothetical protein [Streptomyces sp. TSRI0281]OKI35022.1 hypothetical protein A6A29_16500 [Streptomyces sp. TSRI0281]